MVIKVEDNKSGYQKETAFLDVKPEHRDAFNGLYRSIADVNSFQLIILQFNDPLYRDGLIEKIESIEDASARLHFTEEDYPTFQSFEQKIEALAKKHKVINVTNLENRIISGETSEVITGFNYHREGIAKSCPAALVLWMTEPDIKAFALGAPDMWAWRAAVLDFSVEKKWDLQEIPGRSFVGGLSLKGRVERINEIKDYLETKGAETPLKVKASLLNEQGELYYKIGKLEEAMELFKKEEVIYEKLGERVGLSRSYGNQALILSDWGKLEEAMALHKKEEVICEELGERAGLSTCYGNQAFILNAWDKLEEAMELLKKQEEICEELGNREGLSRSYGNQALILRAWGKLEEAMELLEKQEEICEELGDQEGLSRSRGNQALILRAWGKLEEAMALHKKEEVICEELGDRAGLSGCYGNQALILKAWGKLEEAMALHKKQETICEELGDQAGLMKTYWNMGLLLREMGRHEEAVDYLRRSIAYQEELKYPDIEKFIEYLEAYLEELKK